MKVQCLACDAINSPRARPAKPVNLAAPLAMVVLLFVTFKAYLELVERTVASFVGLLFVDAVIFALFALPARRRIRELLVSSHKQSRWILAAVLVGLLIALSQFQAERFLHWLGEPLDPGLLIWFEERGAPAWLAVLCAVVFGPLIYVTGWQGYFQMELSRSVTPLQASLITALVSAASDMYPERLPFDFIMTVALCELRRKSSSLIPCLVSSSLAGALQVFVFNAGR
jgi:hypothetical protein